MTPEEKNILDRVLYTEHLSGVIRYVESLISKAVAEAGAEERERCVDFIEHRYQSGICSNDIEEMREADPKWLEKRLARERLMEHAQTCRRPVGIGTVTMCSKDSPCSYRQEIERKAEGETTP